MEQAHCGQDMISGYCNYCTVNMCMHPSHTLRLSATSITASQISDCVVFFSFSISKVIGLSPVLLHMLASESLKIHLLPILLHLLSDFCLQSKMSKWQFLWLACNSSVLVADKDNFHSTRTLQSTSSLSLERTKVNTGVSTYNFCDAHVKFFKIMHDYHPNLLYIGTLPRGHTGTRYNSPFCMSHAPPATYTHWLQTSCRACFFNRSSFTLLSSKQRA